MTDLIQRIEEATGPDRESDAEIFSVVFPEKVPSPIVEEGYGWRFTGQLWWLQTGEDARTLPKKIVPPRYTGSIDAAMTLVPEGEEFALMSIQDVFHAGIGETDGQADFYSVAATPALALCAAALRASDGETG